MNEAKLVVLVTGASGGLGRAISKRFAQAGYWVAVNYRGDFKSAEETLLMVQEAGGSGALFQADVSVATEVQRLVSDVVATAGGLDVLVNNAGIAKDGLLLRMSEDAWDAVLDTNLKGAFLCAKEVAKIMVRKRYGRILNVSSVSGIMGNPGQANYSAAKAGLIGLTRSLAIEMASRNITVNAVAPGFLEVGIPEQMDPKTKEQIVANIPLRRMGTAEEVASLLFYLASTEASYITGQTFVIDGGLTV